MPDKQFGGVQREQPRCEVDRELAGLRVVKQIEQRQPGPNDPYPADKHDGPL